jgi:AcrR family transcriptional regulator
MGYVDADTRRAQVVQAARTVLMRSGVAGLTMRAVASEAGIPLGTLHYVFPSKELLYKSVIEDVGNEIAALLHASINVDGGFENSIANGIRDFWSALVIGNPDLQLVQYDLTIHAIRTPGLQHLAKGQYEKYCSVVAEWCQSAAEIAGESCAVSFEELARMIVAGVDGLILQYLSRGDVERGTADIETLCVMVSGVVRGERSPV